MSLLTLLVLPPLCLYLPRAFTSPVSVSTPLSSPPLFKDHGAATSPFPLAAGPRRRRNAKPTTLRCSAITVGRVSFQRRYQIQTKVTAARQVNQTQVHARVCMRAHMCVCARVCV